MSENGNSPQQPSAAGFVLAGGHSSRMGADKALSLFGGIPLIQVALETLTEAHFSACIAGSRSKLGEFAQEIPDTFPESGPMGGVHAALAASTSEWNLFLPVDLPLMPSSLLSSLLQRAQLTSAPVTVPRVNGRIEPFPVVLRSAVFSGIAQRIAAGETACHQAWQTIPAELGASLDAVDVESLLQCGQCTPGRGRVGLPPALWFHSANTPEALATLNRIGAEMRPHWSLRTESAPFGESQVI
jgi:molybdopterin-guanine dinucleotide biosynthesis protein A